MAAHFTQPIVPSTPRVQDQYRADLKDRHNLELLLDESNKLRARIAERPSRREYLEAMLLEVCISQVDHLRAEQERRDGLVHVGERDPLFSGPILREARENVARESATLARLVRIYRLFVQGHDPADFTGLFNPFLDWISVHRADDRPTLEGAINDFVTSLPLR